MQISKSEEKLFYKIWVVDENISLTFPTTMLHPAATSQKKGRGITKSKQ